MNRPAILILARLSHSLAGTEDGYLVEEKTARELKKLLGELVDHSYGHHKAIHGLARRVKELEQRVRALERKSTSQ